MNLIVESRRDKRVLDWLVTQIGAEAVAKACFQLAGQRRAYVSNVAKVLGLTPPAELALASQEDAQRHLERIYQILGVSRSTGYKAIRASGKPDGTP